LVLFRREEGTMIRKTIAVIAGYAVFTISSVLLFRLTGQNPHQGAPVSFMRITAAYGILFSVLAGLVVQFIAKQTTLGLNLVLACVIFLFAAMSMLLSGGSHWTQWFAMFIFAPISVLGGYLANRRERFRRIT